jgi:cytochrome c556
MASLRSCSLIILAALALSGCGEAPDNHPQKLVTQRKALFKQFTKTLEPMGMVARGRKDYNPREFHVSALELQKLSSQPWRFFTADGNYPPTHAASAVWVQAAEFKAAQDSYLEAVNQLVKAAQTGELEQARGAVSAVEKSCKSCHQQFRNDSAS